MTWRYFVLNHLQAFSLPTLDPECAVHCFCQKNKQESIFASLFVQILVGKTVKQALAPFYFKNLYINIYLSYTSR